MFHNISVLPDPHPQEDDAKFFEFSKRAEDGPPQAGTLSYHQFPGAPQNLRLAMNLSHLMILAAGYRLLPLAAENQGLDLTSRSCNDSDEVDCPTSFISGVSEAATVVVRSLKLLLLEE